MITKESDVFLSDYYRRLLTAVLRNIPGNSLSLPSEEWSRILHERAMSVTTCDSSGKFTISLYPLE
jgi:hypothetical protein